MFLLTMITAKSQTLAERVNAKNATLIDVRTPEEFAKGTAEGAINIPLEEMELDGKN